MISKVVSGRRLDRKPLTWLKWAKENGPVAIHERGEQRYVLMSYEDYLTLPGHQDDDRSEERPKSP